MKKVPLSRIKQKGFTLIELLVVIAIVSLLSSIVMATLNSSRSKARDTRRVADINQLKTALELYYDSNKQYPLSGGATSPNNSWNNSNDSSWATLKTAMTPYITDLPIDPKQDSSGWAPSGKFSYAYLSRGYGCPQQWYMIVYLLEKASGPDMGVTACDGTFFRYGGSGANTAIKTVGVGK